MFWFMLIALVAVVAAVAPYQRFGLWLRGGVESRVESREDVRAENRELRSQLMEAEAELLTAQVALRELEALRRQAGFAVGRPRLIPAAVVSVGGGDGWTQRVRIDKGRKDGVAPQCPVLSSECLVGRVVEVTESTADVLLITDVNSRVACAFDPDIPSARAVVSGGGRGSARDSRLRLIATVEPLRLEYLGRDVALPEDATVVTSGLGGVYPRGIPVGRLVAPSPDASGLYQRGRVVPFVDFAALRYVAVMASDK
ncbi:MAG: rod shape-determining protein MreC [Kiritimatiellaeota bacterium]|nr:rod shape-determining protein MreC [Kiritimatiellota bacterium]